MWKGNKAARKRRQRNRQRGKGGGGAHLREAHSRANLSIATPRPLPEMVEVCFLAMGKPTQVDYAVSIIRNIEAHAANDVRYHMLVDKPPAPLEAQMRARAVWRGLPMERIRLQSVVDMSESAKTLYKALSATATGPGGLYLYKPLLHLVLPRSVPRVIVLDTDLFAFASLRGLWDLFGRFETPQLIGLAQARPPHTRPPMPPTHPPAPPHGSRQLRERASSSPGAPHEYRHRPAALAPGRSNARRTKRCARWVGAASMAACSCSRSTRCARRSTTGSCSGSTHAASCP